VYGLTTPIDQPPDYWRSLSQSSRTLAIANLKGWRRQDNSRGPISARFLAKELAETCAADRSGFSRFIVVDGFSRQGIGYRRHIKELTGHATDQRATSRPGDLPLLCSEKLISILMKMAQADCKSSRHTTTLAQADKPRHGRMAASMQPPSAEDLRHALIDRLKGKLSRTARRAIIRWREVVHFARCAESFSILSSSTVRPA